MVWCMYMLQNDYHKLFSKQPSSHIVTFFFSCSENFKDLFWWQCSNTQWRIVGCSQHAVNFIPRINLLYRWEFVPFDHLHPFIYPPSLPLTITNLISVSMNLVFLDSACKWGHRVFFFELFHWENIFKVHPFINRIKHKNWN